MSELEIQVLGPPQIRHEEQILTFPTRKALALLLYLSVEEGTHSREKVTDLLWPEADTIHGRGMLRLTLGYVRKGLARTSQAEEASHLLTSYKSVGLDCSNATVDLHSVRNAFTTLQHLPPKSNSSSKMSRYERAVLLTDLHAAIDGVRGSFLEGFSLKDAPDFDTWISIQRATVVHWLDHIYEQLVLLHSEAGEGEQAIDTARGWVKQNPLHEQAHQQLIQAYLLMGNRSAAIQTYEDFRERLAAELQIEPMPETHALVEQARRVSLQRKFSFFPPPPSQKQPMIPANFVLPLVGRSREFATLMTCYHAARQGKVQVILLEGEPGIGKTRLAEEFLSWATAQGASSLQGRAVEARGRIPYQSIIEALQRYITQAGPLRELLADIWIAELARLLPELRERFPDLSLPVNDEQTAATRLFEAVIHLGQALSIQHPLILFFDDLQWADSATLDLLRYAARRWTEESTSIVLLLSTRTDAVPVKNIYLQQEAGTHFIPLTTLSSQEVFHIVDTLFKQSHSKQQQERISNWLSTLTGGQPFYLLETLKELLEKGFLIFQERNGVQMLALEEQQSTMIEGTGFPSRLLPLKVRDLILQRFTSLSMQERSILIAGTILGQRFTCRQLCRVAGLGENEGVEAIEVCVGVQMLEELRKTQGSKAEGLYSFSHDLLREVIYIEAGDARRQLYHRRAFELLMQEKVSSVSSPSQE